jgi:hypothetical protein
MPRTPNKVLIDELDFEADSIAMHRAFESASLIGDEIIKIGELLNPGSGGIIGNTILKRDADMHLTEQEDICTEIRKALAHSVTRQRALNDKRRKFLDAELDKLP